MARRARRIISENLINPCSESPPIDAEVLAAAAEKLEIYYDHNIGKFWAKEVRKIWIKLGAKDIERRLKKKRFRGSKRDGDSINDVEWLIEHIQNHKCVDFAGELAGHFTGVKMLKENQMFLITRSPKLIMPAQGEYPILRKFLSGLLGGKQLFYFCAWLKFALENLYGKTHRDGQVLILAGPKDSGKSLLQKLITLWLGGRSGLPYPYMSGQTPFNGELARAEHLLIQDEQASTDMRSRLALAAKIKEYTANEERLCHFKYRTPIVLPPVLQRLSISINDEPEHLLIVPPIDDSLEDKIILFKVEKHDAPMSTVTMEERQKYWDTLETESPAFLFEVLQTEIPSELASNRFGVTHYHQPELLAAIQKTAPEIKLLEMIDLQLFSPADEKFGFFSCNGEKPPSETKAGSSTPKEWKGTATELTTLLTEDLSFVRTQARDLLKWSQATSTYLGRLKTMGEKEGDQRVFYCRTETQRAWRILSPDHPEIKRKKEEKNKG